MVTKRVVKDERAKYRRAVDALNKNTIKVGIFGQDDSKMLMIARVNEFGVKITVTPKMRAYLNATGLHLKASTKKIIIPERSFIRGSYNNNKAKIKQIVAKEANNLLTLKTTPSIYFNRVGEQMVSITKRYMTDLKDPPNHSYTLKQKGPKANPLLSSGHLRNSVVWKKVRKR